MPNLGQSIETSYIPSEGYMGETRNIRMPSEQTRSGRFEDEHFMDHVLFGARDHRTPRALFEKRIPWNPSPDHESPDGPLPSFRSRQRAESAVPSYRHFQASRDEDRQQFKPSSWSKQTRPAHFDQCQTDTGRNRHYRSVRPESQRKTPGVSNHVLPQKSPGKPKKTVRFADDYTSDSAPRKRTTTKKSINRQTPSGLVNPGSHHASGTQPGRATHASKAVPNSPDDSHSREGQKRQSSYYRVPSPPPTPRIPREPTPEDFETKAPYERDPARHQFCACCPPSSTGCDRARERRVSTKMYKQRRLFPPFPRPGRAACLGVGSRAARSQ
ncbi:hypothetical protein F5X99DRAFT_378957 [Biscogniauxia marginata]|nr:hypothetical protein F5X99DRAFT_378957 [Biscogniauxia marginata]